MDSDITIVPLEPRYADQIEAWSTDGALRTLLKQPGVAASDPGRTEGWVALRDKQPIALVTISLDDARVGYLNVVVKPSDRRHGIGEQMVQYALGQPSVVALTKLRVLVERDNMAAQKLLSAQGFSKIGFTQDGRIEFMKR